MCCVSAGTGATEAIGGCMVVCWVVSTCVGAVDIVELTIMLPVDVVNVCCCTNDDLFNIYFNVNYGKYLMYATKQLLVIPGNHI